MGCGSSCSAGAFGPGAKDPDDYRLDHIEFQKFGIPKFDDFASCIADPCNTIIDISNAINECITDVQDAAALATGAYRLDLDIKGAKDYDKVLLTFTKADNTYATGSEILAIAGLDKAKAAAEKLAKARSTLDQALEKTPKSLEVIEGKLTPSDPAEQPSAEVTAFNTALSEFKVAVGAGFKVGLSVVAAGSPGAPTVRVRYGKPQFKSPTDTTYTLAPLHLLDIANTQQARAIFAAEATTAKMIGALTKALKDVPATEYKLEIRGRVIDCTFPNDVKKAAAEKKAREARMAADDGKKKEDRDDNSDSGGACGEGDEDDDACAAEEPAPAEETPVDDATPADPATDDAENAAPAADDAAPADKSEDAKAKKAAGGGAAAGAAKAAGGADTEEALAAKKQALKKAVSNANVELFKLAKSLQNVNGPISLAKGVVAILDSVKAWVADKATNAGKQFDISKAIKVNPKIKTDEDGSLDFDLGMAIGLPDEPDMSLEQLVTHLPGPAQLLYKAVMNIKTRVSEVFPKVSKLKDEIVTLVDQADKTFDNAGETIAQHLAGSSPMQIMKTVSAVPGNLLKIKNCVQTALVFALTVKRITTELYNSFSDMKAAVATVAA